MLDRYEVLTDDVTPPADCSESPDFAHAQLNITLDGDESSKSGLLAIATGGLDIAKIHKSPKPDGQTNVYDTLTVRGLEAGATC